MEYSDVKSMYDTVSREADLLGWVNALLNERGYHKVKPGEWRKYKPSWESPWSYGDVREIADKIKGLRDYHSHVYTLTGSFVPHWFVIKFGQEAQDIRGFMGLDHPVAFEELDNVMNRYHKEGELLTLQYAKYKDSGQFPGVWKIKEIRFSHTNLSLVLVKSSVDLYSKYGGIHPALALTYFLCEIPIYSDDLFFFTNNVYQGITVDIRGPLIPKSKVALAYSKVQNHMLKKVKHKTRPMSKRVNEMLRYIDHPLTSTLTWENRLSSWNKQYPEWRYASVNSMQVTYKRAKDRMKPSPLRKTLEKRTDEVSEQYHSTMVALRLRQRDQEDESVD